MSQSSFLHKTKQTLKASPAGPALSKLRDSAPLAALNRTGNQSPSPHETAMLTATESMVELLRDMKEQSQQIRTELAASRTELAQTKTELTHMKNELARVRQSVEITQLGAISNAMDRAGNFLSTHLLSPMDTLERLAHSDVSIARFGDGELKLMLDPLFELGFQKNSQALAEDLQAIFTNPADGLMISLPQFARGAVWQRFWAEFWGTLEPLVSEDRQYANTHVSRSLIFQKQGDAAVELWREVWKDKTVTVVTGKGSRFDLLPALFDSAASIKRVDSLPANAYTDIPRLLEEPRILDSELVILSLGPSGTILASELHQRGIRALDIGHLTASYVHVMEGGQWPEQRSIAR